MQKARHIVYSRFVFALVPEILERPDIMRVVIFLIPLKLKFSVVALAAVVILVARVTRVNFFLFIFHICPFWIYGGAHMATREFKRMVRIDPDLDDKIAIAASILRVPKYEILERAVQEWIDRNIEDINEKSNAILKSQ